MNILSYNKEEFLLDGKPFRILSGSIHYFRVVEEYWEDRLKKLKACGFNTVETYTCWNLHEPREGEFVFEGMLNIEKFIDTAKDLGLYVIIRPGPYICAEFDFGGLPAWLLKYPDMRIRCNDALYLSKVERYYSELFRRLCSRLSTNGGNIIAVQIENEYGSFGNDKEYLYAIADIYKKNNVDCLLFTSDGKEHSMMTGGTLPEYLATINFGGHVDENHAALVQHRPSQPKMCCEFWNGWFDHWYEEHHRRDNDDVLASLGQWLDTGASINMYMFHGGTNFGFTNGANDFGVYEPTITSYDYDCPLNECGDLTPKYFAVKQLFEERFAKTEEIEVSDTPKAAYGKIELTEQALLFENLDNIAIKTQSPYPLTMEELDQNFGFVLYSKTLKGPHEKCKLNLDDMHDRAQIYLNGKLAGIQENTKKRFDEVEIQLDWNEEIHLAVLVENMGRANYGAYMWRRKGLRNVRLGNRFEFGWSMYSIACENIGNLRFKKSNNTNDVPVFLKGCFCVGKPADTFLRLDGFTKGVAFINGFNIGRYFNIAGPQKTLYIPAPLLKTGENEIVVFEQEATQCNEVVLTDKMDLG